jgi:hypothetical protein
MIARGPCLKSCWPFFMFHKVCEAKVGISREWITNEEEILIGKHCPASWAVYRFKRHVDGNVNCREPSCRIFHTTLVVTRVKKDPSTKGLKGRFINSWQVGRASLSLSSTSASIVDDDDDGTPSWSLSSTTRVDFFVAFIVNDAKIKLQHKQTARANLIMFLIFDMAWWCWWWVGRWYR